MTRIHDPTICQLGEGPLWHPERNQLFWFDIPGRKLLTRRQKTTRTWQFEEPVSAAGWVDSTTLLIASASALFSFDVETGSRQHVAPLEADNPVTRSNDGRADPWGGFWIGTMGLGGETKAGSIHRYYRGELRLLFPEITTTNAICFDPDGGFALYCDTRERAIRKVRLGAADGWPEGPSEIFIDLRQEGLRPDGAVIDTDGNVWNAQFGAGRVAVYNRRGEFVRAVTFDAPRTTCPAFGGEDLSTLFVTTAAFGLPADEIAAHPESGMTFAVDTTARGQQEHKVIL